MSHQPQDHKARQEALDPTRSFAVTAPAGSGKTELLTQRVLKLLSVCERPEEILCITFTRKAAGEMKARINESLKLALTIEPDEPHKKQTWQLAHDALKQDQEKQWHLLSNPNRLKVMTIDGLCSNLTKHLPIEAQFGAQPHIIDNFDPCYDQAIQNTLAFLESDTPYTAAIETLLTHLDNDLNRVSGLLKLLILRREQWLGYILHSQDAREDLEFALLTLIEEELQVLYTALAPHESQLLPLINFAAANLHQSNTNSPLSNCLDILELPSFDPESLPLWRGIIELFLTKDGKGWRKRLDKNMGFPTGDNKIDKAIAKEKKAVLSGIIATLSEEPGLLEQCQLVRRLPQHQYQPSQVYIH